MCVWEGSRALVQMQIDTIFSVISSISNSDVENYLCT